MGNARKFDDVWLRADLEAVLEALTEDVELPPVQLSAEYRYLSREGCCEALKRLQRAARDAKVLADGAQRRLEHDGSQHQTYPETLLLALPFLAAASLPGRSYNLALASRRRRRTAGGARLDAGRVLGRLVLRQAEEPLAAYADELCHVAHLRRQLVEGAIVALVVGAHVVVDRRQEEEEVAFVLEAQRVARAAQGAENLPRLPGAADPALSAPRRVRSLSEHTHIHARTRGCTHTYTHAHTFSLSPIEHT